MGEFVITTESNSDLSASFIADNHITIIPHYYTVEETVYGDGVELSTKEFYDAMRAQKKAATMASNPAVISEIFRNYAKQGFNILHISFSSALSSGYSNVLMVSQEIMEEYPSVKIIVIDTLSASLCEAFMIMKALELQKEGKSLEETSAVIESLVPHLCAQFTVDDLNHLYRGGRLSKATAILGTMINIKPILYINKEGALVLLSKARGRKKSLSMLVDNMAERIGSFQDKQIAIGIVHGDCEEDANCLAVLVKERFGYENFVIAPVGPSIGAHSGPGAIGLIFLGDYR